MKTTCPCDCNAEEMRLFLVEYEIASSRWMWLCGLMPFEWVQDFTARYFVHLVTRKIRRWKQQNNL